MAAPRVQDGATLAQSVLLEPDGNTAGSFLCRHSNANCRDYMIRTVLILYDLHTNALNVYTTKELGYIGLGYSG